jgi:hypothetical protein
MNFFCRYFKESDKGQKPKAVKPKEEELSDAESVGDEEFEDLMGNYFKTNGALESEDENEDEEEGVDFAAQIKPSKGNKGKKRKVEEEEEESEDDDEDDEAIDFEGDDDADELINEDSEDEDEEPDLGRNYEDDDDDDLEEFGGASFKSKLKAKVCLYLIGHVFLGVILQRQSNHFLPLFRLTFNRRERGVRSRWRREMICSLLLSSLQKFWNLMQT